MFGLKHVDGSHVHRPVSHRAMGSDVRGTGHLNGVAAARDLSEGVVVSGQFNAQPIQSGSDSYYTLLLSP